MVDITGFFVGFLLVNAIALAAFVVFAAVGLTRFFAANRKVRIAHSQPVARYYAHEALGH